MSEWPAAENDKKCLLVIDDDQTLRDSLRMILQSSFHVLTVESVDSAAELLKSGQPDAIILDLNMPEKDGLQGLREIHPSHPEVPILMLTGYADNQTIEEALNLGAAGIMRKSFELINLVSQITEMTNPAVVPSATMIRSASH